MTTSKGDIVSRLYVTDGGMIACGEHGGSYLRAAVARRPKAKRYVTPLDRWEVVDDAMRAEWVGAGVRCECEVCGA
jgi:hypothetical protein